MAQCFLNICILCKASMHHDDNNVDGVDVTMQNIE